MLNYTERNKANFIIAHGLLPFCYYYFNNLLDAENYLKYLKSMDEPNKNWNEWYSIQVYNN